MRVPFEPLSEDNAITAANRSGDAKHFAAWVTDGYVFINSAGMVTLKGQRMGDIAKGQDLPDLAAVESNGTRVYGDLAVTNQVNRSATRRTRQTIVHVKQNGRWLRAAVIATPIATGKPASQ